MKNLDGASYIIDIKIDRDMSQSILEMSQRSILKGFWKNL